MATKFLIPICSEEETNLTKIRTILLWNEPLFRPVIDKVEGLIRDNRVTQAEALLYRHSVFLTSVGDTYFFYSTYPYEEPQTRLPTDEDDKNKHLFVLLVDDRHPNPKKTSIEMLENFLSEIKSRGSSPRRTLKDWMDIHQKHIECRNRPTGYQAALQSVSIQGPTKPYDALGFGAAATKFHCAFSDLTYLLFPSEEVRKELGLNS